MEPMQSFRKLFAATVLTACALSLSACKPDAAIKQGEIIGRGTKNPTPPPAAGPGEYTPYAPVQNAGSISGTILFHGTAPSRTIDTSMDPACALSGKPTLPTEQYVVKNGKLANVFLYVKTGPPAAMEAGPTSQQPVVLDQRRCQYVPHVIALMAGGYVEFRNSDPTMHNVHTEPTVVGNDTIDISMGPRGQPQTKQFFKPELMIPVRCNNHPWMNAFINVSATPFFAVSDADGHFDLRGLPPGTYTIGAVHEKLGEKTMQVTVAPNGKAKADFSFAM
jgi:plastocyanin